MLNDLLFELGTEELPSGAVRPLAEALAMHVVAGLAKAGILHGKVFQFATPRRLAFRIEDVAETQPTQQISRRGPAVSMDSEGKPTQALRGFAASCGVSIDALTTIKTDKGVWWMYEAEQAGASTCDLLPGLINEALAALPIAKPMRWGDSDALFARPVHWALLLWGADVVSTQVLGVQTGRQTYGHRFHHPEAIDIPTPRAYERSLQEAYVLADFSVRRQVIIEQIQQLTSEEQVLMPHELLDEVTSIVEWPEALRAGFDPVFLEVPADVLIASMQSHQKCFALQDKQGRLLPYFITVSNIASTNPSQVILGNEKVMRARLSDAAFFFQQDKRQPLAAYQAATAHVIFQERLGSLQDKTQRMQVLLTHLIEPLLLDSAEALRAVELSKCDLMTGMVGEFPELQGLMGSYYARHDGECEAVALALHEQYMPRFADDQLPQSALGLALSLADRLDTLVGAFAIGQKPTAVKDPFKLRRHALAVIRLLMATSATLSLSGLITKTWHTFDGTLPRDSFSPEDLKSFILDRLVSYYHGQGISSEWVGAVRARQEDDLFDLDKRVKALSLFVQGEDALSLSSACKRVNKLLQQSSALTLPELNECLLKEPAEQHLFARMEQVANHVAPHYSAGEYGVILEQLAHLREPVDAFFEHVMVMVDESAVRENRLALLARLQHLLQGVADISLLPS